MNKSIRAEEVENLQKCIARIDQIINEENLWLSKGKTEGSGNKYVDIEVRRIKENNRDSSKEARPKPYIGRVDFSKDNSPDKTETYYFGKFAIPEHLSSTYPKRYVISFGADAYVLWVDPLKGKYIAPVGEITGDVKLKRGLIIEESQLRRIIEFDLGRKEKPAKEADPFLTQELSKAKGDELSDIVATIKPEQYEEVAAALEQVIIIQGVAGSGKSEVGLHRVVYLLSPHRETKLGILPERVVFFGPSRPFLNYVFSLLPSFRVYAVRQTTIRDWLKGTLSSRVRIESKDRLLEKLLKVKKETLAEELKVSRFKVSIQMARILKRYIKALRDKFTEDTTDIFRGREVIINAVKIRRIIRGSQSQPLNEQRVRVLSQLYSEIQKRSLKMLDETIRMDVEAQFSRFWPQLNLKETYAWLLSSEKTLLTYAKGSITPIEAKHFTSSSSGKHEALRSEDLPAICYLDHLLNDRVNIQKRGKAIHLFEHVVIDEAQDVSPLELLLLYRHSKNKSFTILGDIGQSVLPHKGITSWRDLKQVFAHESIHKSDMQISLRSTYEITRYANRIFKKIAPGLPIPIPYERHGEKPVLISAKSYADMVMNIAEDIRFLKNKDIQTIAVLCKTSSEAATLQKKLYKAGIQDAVPLDKTGYSRGKIAVSSIYLTKGLEYDAVILANARRNNYSGSTLHNRLLYLAVTRPAQVLHIHWFGTLADILVDATLLPKIQKTKSRKKNKRVNKQRSVKD